MAFATAQQLGLGTPFNYNPQFQQGLGAGQLSGANVGPGGVFNYRPPDEHLVAGQLRKNIDSKSPLMLQAAGNAQEVANARGMGSGAYAIGEAQRATIDSMLPVAAQDSETLTKVGMMNAKAAQDKDLMMQQALMAGGNQSGVVVEDMSAQDREAERQLRLQLQREALAFEGEQGAYTREQQQAMGLMGMYGDLYQGQQNFGNQRQLGYDRFGFDRALAGDQFGYARALAGDQFGYNSSLARQNADLDLRQSYFNYNTATARGMQDFYQQIILGGMQNPEFMADPEGFFGFAEFATGSVPGPGADFFSRFYGGGRGGKRRGGY